jgi:hypothetical protein
MAPPLLVLSAIESNNRAVAIKGSQVQKIHPPFRQSHRDVGNIERKDLLTFCVSIQFLAGENCADLAFIFCEMREQTGSASETKCLLPSSRERGRLNSSRLVSKQNPPLF